MLSLSGTLGGALVLPLAVAALAGGDAPAQMLPDWFETRVVGEVGLAVRRPEHDPVRYSILRSLGYFVTERWEPGIRLGVLGDGNGSLSTVTDGRIDYLVSPGRTAVPYLGIHGGGATRILGGSFRTTALWGGHIGLKMLVTVRSSVNVELSYTAPGDDPGAGYLSLGVSGSWYSPRTGSPPADDGGPAEPTRTIGPDYPRNSIAVRR